MFSSLRTRLATIFDKIRKRGVLDEQDVQAALREIRIALLEADVALSVVKDFIAHIQEKAVGQDVVRNVQPAQMVIKIVHDELIALLGEAVPLNTSAKSPFGYLIMGLQGSGKTTSAAKLAYFLTHTMKKRCLLVSLDIYRPAAQKQLEILAQQGNLRSLSIVPHENPHEIIQRAQEEAKKTAIDVIIFDTAGRLHVDEELMKELEEIHKKTLPLETILIADSLMGQDAVRMAKAFHERIPVSSLMLTRIDGDGRGGAALSVRHVVGCPIKFMGMGEKIDQLEVFDPKRIADQILDMGDVVSFVEKAAASIDEGSMTRMASQFEKGQFNLNDMVSCLESMQKMGGFSGVLNFLPGAGRIKEHMHKKGLDEQRSNAILQRQVALVYSMTSKERVNPSILNASRRKRIALGAGQKVEDVNRLIKQFQQMQTVMKQLKGNGFMRMSRLFKK